MVKGLLTLALVAVLSGCTLSSRPPPPEDPRGVWCANNSPRTDDVSGESRSVKEEFLIHQRKGQEWCGWTPPSGSVN